MNFGNKLQYLLLEKGSSRKILAEKLKITPTSLTRYIKEKREPDINTLIKIADFFEVSLDYLLDREDEAGIIVNELPLPEEHRKLINMFDELDPDFQLACMKYVENLVELSKKDKINRVLPVQNYRQKS